MARLTAETTITISTKASRKIKRIAKRHNLSVFRYMEIAADYLQKHPIPKKNA